MSQENQAILLKDLPSLKNSQAKREDAVKEVRDEILKFVNQRVAEKVASISEREKNIAFNNFEHYLGKITLESTPEGIGIGAHYKCNARCTFCLGGEPQLFSLERYRNFFEPKLRAVISKAKYISFCGFGELLLMPKIEEFLDYINEKLPDANKIFTTNGIPLTSEVSKRLIQSQSVVEISLHASNSELHRLLTKTNAFARIVSQIKDLTSIRKQKGYPTISLIFLITTLNIENLPDFVQFAARLGADEVICNYLTVFTPAQLKLSCFFKHKITNSIFQRAEEAAERLKIPIKLPPKFGTNDCPDERKICSEPWKYFYVETEGSVLPCCHAGDHIGYLNQVDFETIWNGATYKWLRSSLIEGRPHQWCKYCYKNKPSNVNDIRSHVSFRPDLQQKVLKGFHLK